MLRIWQNHKPLLFILLIYAALALTYSLLLPLGESADETPHFALIRFIAEKGRPPLTVEERIAIGTKGDAAPFYHGLVALVSQHVDVSALPSLPRLREHPERAIPDDGRSFHELFHTEDEIFPFRGIVLAWHLARLISIPLGMLSIIAVYLTVWAIYPQRRAFALTAAGFVAFLPRFVMNGAVVNDDNLVIPLIAFALYFLTRALQGDDRRAVYVWLGFFAGLSVLAKYHSLLLLPEITALFVWLAWQKGWGWRGFWRRWGGVMLVFSLTAGWWFIFLLFQFNQVAELGWTRGLLAPLGDPVMTAGVSDALTSQASGGAAAAFGWADWGSLTFKTFWVSYGSRRVLASPLVYRLLAAIAVVSFLGLFRLARRQLRFLRHLSLCRLDIAVLALHLFIYLALVVLRYIFTPSEVTSQGRHLYPALTSIAFFFVLGLSGIVALLGGSQALRDKWLAISLNGALLTFSLAVPFVYVLPAYRPYLPLVSDGATPAAMTHKQTISFAQEIQLEGYTLNASTINAGEIAPLTLYWRAKAGQSRDYVIRLCLRDAFGKIPSCRYSYPVDGRYPPRAWEDGYLIRDELYLPTPDCLSAGDYDLLLSILPLRPDEAMATVEQADEPPEALLGRVIIAARSQPGDANWTVWAQGRAYRRGTLELPQIRSAATWMIYGKSEGAIKRLHGESTWTPSAPPTGYTCPDGTPVETRHYLLSPGVEPGGYRLWLNEQMQDQLTLQVTTRARNFTLPNAVPTLLNAEFAEDVMLLGYGLDLSPRFPGDVVEIDTYWQAQRAMSRLYIVALYLLDPTMAARSQFDGALVYSYPNTLWAPGEAVEQAYYFPLNKTPPGLYTVQFSLYTVADGQAELLPFVTPSNLEADNRFFLGQLRVLDPARDDPPQRLLNVILGQQVQLIGYDLPAPELEQNTPMKFALHWQAIRPPAGDYTVFTQLIGPDGQVWAQQDNQPQENRYPTTVWQVNDRVVDRYELTLREGAPPGDYRLLVGMYDLNTGQRLSVVDADGNLLPDNAILLTPLKLVE